MAGIFFVIVLVVALNEFASDFNKQLKKRFDYD